MSKKKTKTQLKNALDAVFSKYIRLKYATDSGYVKCYTCGAIHHWKEMDAGHFHSRRFMNTRWDERNVFPQCRKCNRFLEGMKPQFTLRRLSEMTKEDYQDLESKTKMSNVLFYVEMEEKLEYYKQKLKELSCKM